MRQTLLRGTAEPLELPGARLVHDSSAPGARLETVVAAVEAWRRGASLPG
jgi:hypothetical protein